MSKEQIKTMQHCEDLADQIAKDFKAMGKEMQANNIMDRVEKEMALQSDLTSFVVKEAISGRIVPNISIIAMLKDMIKDGYKNLSLPLSNEILNF